MGRDSLFGIATDCGLEGPGIESRWGGEIFRIRQDRPWGPPSLLYGKFRVSVKIKVKLTLEQATKAQRESRCIAVLFL